MFVGILCSRRASKFAKFLTLLARHDYQPTWFDHNHAILPIVEHGGVVPGGGGGTPYMGYIDMCRGIGHGF